MERQELAAWFRARALAASESGEDGAFNTYFLGWILFRGLAGGMGRHPRPEGRPMREAERQLLNTLYAALWKVMPADADPQIRLNVFMAWARTHSPKPDPAPVAEQAEEAP